MAGINPNLNVKNLQLQSTTKVEAEKPEDNEVGEAKPSAVWNADSNSDGNWRKGDIIKGKNGYVRITKVRGDGTYDTKPITRDKINDKHFEHDRGDYNVSDYLNGNY